MIELPEGYCLIPRDHPAGAPRGLRLGTPWILATAADCWHARVRDTSYRIGGPPWYWIHDADPRAAMRYRIRAWTALNGPLPADHTPQSSCGEGRCLNPLHQRLVERVAATPPPPTPRCGWIGTGEEEYWGPIEDPTEFPPKPAAAPREGPAPTPKRAPRAKPSRPRRVAAPRVREAAAPGARKVGPGHARGEAHCRAKLTADDVRAIRAATGITQAALGTRYGITAAGIRRILTRKAWAHVE